MCQNYSQNTMTMNDAEVSNDQSKQKSINQSSESSDADASAKVNVKEDSSESKIIEPVAADTRSNDSPAAAGNDKASSQAQTTTTTTITAKRDFNRFPEKLLKILDSKEYVEIFSWSPSGKSFVIHKPYELISQVLVKHFDAKEDMKFDSFLRKLYRWGFSKKTVDDQDGDEEGAHIYFHGNFQQGDFDKCAKVTCTSKPTTSRPSALQRNNGVLMPVYGMPGMMPPQMAGMFPSAGTGMLPMMADPQQQASLVMGRDIYRQSQLPNALNGAAGLPGLGTRNLLLQQQQQELRDREQQLLLLQHQHQQNLYNANIGVPPMLGQPTIARDRFPLHSFEQQQYQGFPQSINANVLGAGRMGQDINQFDRARMQTQNGNARHQNQNAMMLPQTNGAIIGGMNGHHQDHRRFIHESQGNVGGPLNDMLEAERQAIMERAGALPMSAQMGTSSLAQNSYQLASQPGALNTDEHLLQRRMLLMSQESKQQTLDNTSLRKRDYENLTGDHQNTSSDRDLDHNAKRINR